MRGYFHWLQARAQRGGETFRPVPVCSSEELLRLAPRLEEFDPPVSALAVWKIRPILILGGSPSWEKRFAARWHGLFDWPLEDEGPPLLLGQAALLILREQSGACSLGMLLRFAGLVHERLAELVPIHPGSPCRALLFEPEVVTRLDLALQTTTFRSPEDVLRQALRRETMNNNLEVARIISAVPELDGEVDIRRDEVRFQRLPIPDGFDLFPPRAEPLFLVVAINPGPE
jgi:hypothetical protein